MSFFRQLFRRDPKLDLSKGQQAFNQRKYKLALKLFENAYKRFENIEMKLIALDNAALSAENAGLYEKASEFYYQAILKKMTNDEYQTKEVMQDIERAIQTIHLSQKPPISINKLYFMKFLIILSEKKFEKLTSFYNKLKLGISDDYRDAIEKTWDLIHSPDTYLKKASIPNALLPEEFNTIKKKAEKIMQRCSLCTVFLKVSDQTELIQKGDEFPLSASLTAHAPLSISSINLKTGTKGRVLSSTIPELPLKMSTGEDYSIVFSLTPNLPGEWAVGPIFIKYSIPSESGKYTVASEPYPILIEEATPALKLSMESETIEEDFDYLIVILVENIGKTIIQNVKIQTEIPVEVKINEGTNEKYISSLVEGEIFQYNLRVQFALDKTHFDGHLIRTYAFIENDRKISKCSIKLGGK
ncbi:MAG: tol-pal system YbgF family protein [Candidatus Hodarchaeota archaeon]